MTTSLTLTVISATPGQITVEARWPLNQPVNTQGLRTLILNMGAMHMGVTLKSLYEAGYDRSHKTGWVITPGPAASGMKRYTARPMTAAERGAELRERGGFVDNGDGSMGFIMPSPRAKARPLTVRQQGGK
jgi:hypothetical protein